MSIESQILEQIQYDEWPLVSIMGFIELSEGDSWLALSNLWHASKISLLSDSRAILKIYEVEEILRNKSADVPVLIRQNRQ